MSIWFGTVGLASDMGGIATVARCTVRALAEAVHRRRHGGAAARLRVISLRDQSADVLSFLPTELRAAVDFAPCRGARSLFAWRVAGQAAGRPDWLLFDHTDLAQCQSFLPAFLRRPHYVWINGIEVWRPLPSRKTMGLQTARKLLAITEFTAKRFSEFHPRHPTLDVAWLCVEPGRQLQAAAESSGAPVILTVGRLEPDRPKGHLEILEALPAVAAKVPNVEWHVVGKGQWLDEFSRRVATSPVASRVRIHGFLADGALDELYRRCAVFCMPSWGEGFGLVYIEAMRRGRLCIGSIHDAAPEVIGDAGVVVDLRQPRQLATELVDLLTDHPRRQALERKALARVRDHFEYESFRARLWRSLSLDPLVPPVPVHSEEPVAVARNT